MQKITTFLTFESRGEEAVNFYTSIFDDAKVYNIVRYEGDDGVLPKGALLHAAFELDGQPFMAMDGGPQFSFAPGHSLFVGCETQEEIDEKWAKLAEGGEEQPCGWIKDRYGIFWQIIPSILGQLITDPDPEKAQRVREAMFQMKKIDIAGLKQAHEGG